MHVVLASNKAHRTSDPLTAWNTGQWSVMLMSGLQEDFIIKISDRGGGIPHDLLDRVTDYNFPTAEQSNDKAAVTKQMSWEKAGSVTYRLLQSTM